MKHKSKQKTNNRRILPSHSTSLPFSGWAKRWIEIVPQPGGQRDEARNTSGSVATYRRAKLQLLLFVYCMINDGTFPILFNPLLSFPHYRTSVSHTHTHLRFTTTKPEDPFIAAGCKNELQVHISVLTERLAVRFSSTFHPH